MVFFTACGESRQPPPVSSLPQREDFHLFLLAGQSNMAGRGKVSAQDRELHSRVLSLSKQGEWIPAVDPLHYDKPVAGVGLARSFGITLAGENARMTIGLIPAAAGGSDISAWKPGGYHGETDSHPYDDALARARRAMKDGELKAVLWHQGESDAEPELANSYEENLRNVISQFREDLGIPELPFIIGQLGQFPGKPWTEWERTVDRAHRNIAEADQNIVFVTSEDLLPMKDRIHFNAESLRRFGGRYAEAYLGMTAPQPDS